MSVRAKNSFILIIGEESLILVPPMGKSGGESLYARSEKESETGSLLHAIAKKPETPVLIIADVAAEEYRRTSLPEVGFFDRSKLIERKLRQFFPASAPEKQLASAIRLAKGDFIFACIHEQSPVLRWIERLESLPNPLIGVLPLPFAGANILRRICPESQRGWAMLFSRQRTGGFRQIVTRDGELIFTRLAPRTAFTASAEQIAASIAAELQLTVDYLARFGLSAQDSLRITAIVSDEFVPAITSLPAPFEAGEILSPHEAGQKLGLAFAPDAGDSFSDVLFAAWASRQRWSSSQILLPREKREEKASLRMRKIGSFAAAFLWLSVLFWLAAQGAELFQLSEKHRNSLAQAEVMREILEKEKISLAPATESLGRLRKAAARKRIFTAPAPEPWQAIADIGASIAQTARLDKFEWKAKDETTGAETVNLVIRLTDSSLPQPSTEAGKKAIVTAISLLARNMEENMSGYKITVTRFPFIIRPDETLTNAGASSDLSAPPTADLLIEKVRQ